MTDPFHSHIRTALQDPILQSALDGNAERRQKAWVPAFASLPESRAELRRRAHSLRAEVIAQLPKYLQQFTERLNENGFFVHTAADAPAAVQIILQILEKNGARRVAKAKSMVSEELHLNHALEVHGIQAVETDLGEYIVQLRKEPPAHIITPAVHLTRGQVAQTFVDTLGVAYSEDIPTLTTIARTRLRQTFLDADAGISGVNFGVAETGTIVLVTNEGNGRMCTTLPRVHIALMGIERIVPTLNDLALMLYLLPRSATGQKLSVYTSLIHAPRRSGELDGPQERHIVLVDNGRSALRGSPLNDVLYCIRCGACLNACPVFREIGGHAYRGAHGSITPYPGPIGSVISPGLFGVEEFGHLARASSLCGACKDACPVDIDLPKMLLRVRTAGVGLELVSAVEPERDRKTAEDSSKPAAHNPGLRPAQHSQAPRGLRLGLRMFTWMARSPRRYAAIQRLAAGMVKLAPWMHGWLQPPAFTGWGYRRDIPLPPGRPFRDRFAALQPEPSAAHPGPASLKALHQDQAIAPAPDGFVPLQTHPIDPAALGDRFCEELETLGGQVIRCGTDAADAILTLLHSRSVEAIQAWEEQALPPHLRSRLEAAGIRIQTQPDPELKIGLTGALAAIAESGTLVMPGDADRPLTASLLPETHLAVLDRKTIVASLAEALTLPDVRLASASVLISGPSRTADIEMTLTIGVHGPREVIVFLIE